MICAKNFNAFIDPNNKWTIVFSDKNDKIIHRIAIPPTVENRFDIISNKNITHGYSLGIDAIIVQIINGEVTLIDATKI